MNDKIKCKRCKVNLTFDKFKKKRDDTYTKMCIECLDKSKTYAEKTKCEHGRQKVRCKECGGSSICEHGRDNRRCKECSGSDICEHGRDKPKCKECKGGCFCEHDKIRSKCRECKGGSFCEHDKIRSICKICKGGSICEHDREKARCKECGGSAICEHNIYKSRCKECNLSGYIADVVRGRIRSALKSDKELHSKEYIGCDIETFKKHIEEQFEEGMTWQNHGDWHVDHIIPIRYKENGKNPSLEEVVERLHYTNTQPLWAEENLKKGNTFIGK